MRQNVTIIFQRIFFGKLHYGLFYGKKISQGKNYVHARIIQV